MKREKKQNNQYAEFHSERIRNLIGEIPTSLSHCGMAIIIIIMAVLILIFFIVPYPYGQGESIFQHFFF